MLETWAAPRREGVVAQRKCWKEGERIGQKCKPRRSKRQASRFSKRLEIVKMQPVVHLGDNIHLSVNAGCIAINQRKKLCIVAPVYLKKQVIDECRYNNPQSRLMIKPWVRAC